MIFTLILKVNITSLRCCCCGLNDLYGRNILFKHAIFNQVLPTDPDWPTVSWWEIK